MALSAQRPPRAQPNPGGWEGNPEDWGCAPSGLVDGSKKCGEPVAGHLSLSRGGRPFPPLERSWKALAQKDGRRRRPRSSSPPAPPPGPGGPFPPRKEEVSFFGRRGVWVRACSSRCVQRGLGSQTLSLGSLEPSLSGPHSWPLSRPVTNVSYAANPFEELQDRTPWNGRPEGPIGSPQRPRQTPLSPLQVWTEEER